MAKAALPSGLSSLVSESARRVYGKQETAAAHLGKDAGNFARDVRAGRLTLADLDRLGPPFLAEVGRELVEQYAPLATPEARFRERVQLMRSLLDELAQFPDFLAGRGR